ncbi:MAG: PsbP-related protein [Patescibacteria group bacterium]|jgi:hypothetical protein
MINQNKFTHLIIAISAFVGAAVIFLGAWWLIFGRSDNANTNTSNTNTVVTINSFAECEAAGYPVMESYPRQCAAGGKTFTEVITNTNTSANTNSGFNPHSNTNTALNTNTFAVTAEWELYVSDRYNYKVKYPANGSYSELGSGISGSDDLGYIVDFQIGNDMVVRVNTSDNSAGVESLEDVLASNMPKYISEDATYEEKTINGERAFVFMNIVKDSSGNEKVVGANTMFITDDIFYQISTGNQLSPEFSSEREALYNSFVSTFQFTSDTTMTSGWQTYTNQAPAFSIDYPDTWELDLSSGNPVMFMDERALAQEVATEMMQGSKVEIWWGGNTAATVTEAVANINGDSTVITQNNVTVDGIAAIRQTGEDVFGAYNNRLYMLKDGRLYSIVQYIPEDEFQGSYTEIFEDMISTFQFTD